jgi:uncharacterized membrane protein YeaQ/YmgE (transglycosylase-associated protein family)
MFWLMWAVVGLLAWWGMGTWFNGNAGLGGSWGALIANLFGAWLGDWALGSWGPMLFGYNWIAGFIGAFVIGYLWKTLTSKL